MITRRSLVTGFSCATAVLLLPSFAAAGPLIDNLPGVTPALKPAPQAKRVVQVIAPVKKAKSKKTPKKPFMIDPQFAPQDVDFYSLFAPGTIIINSQQKLLYLVEPGNKARRYGVAIGKEGLGWKGIAKIRSKVEWPNWKPTNEMLARSPEKYTKYKDGMPGGPGNPLGARAMYLYQGKRDTQIRIHGTTQPWTIGQAASNGCFRMVNEHIIDLFDRVKWGAPVIVV